MLEATLEETKNNVELSVFQLFLLSSLKKFQNMSIFTTFNCIDIVFCYTVSPLNQVLVNI